MNKIVNNVIWRFFERCGAQLVTFIVTIILGRLLSPNEYGVIAIVDMIIIIFNVFIDNGLASSLIQKKDADQLDFSSVFFTNIFLCLIIYSLLFFISPLIASFYDNSQLTNIIRVLGITIIVSSVKNILQSYVSKKMIFKKFFYSTLIGTIISGIIGIIMALKGFGVWSLVAQSLLNISIDTLVLWFIIDWRPTLEFSFERTKKLLTYGYRILLSSLINNIYSCSRQLTIGKLYSSSSLAFYNKGNHFPSLLVSNYNTSIDSVLFPAMSERQDHKDEIKELIRMSIGVSTFILYPILFGLIAISTHLIPFLLTEKWNGTIPYLIVFCLSYLTFPLQTANLNAIKASGYSKSYFKLEIIETVIGVTLFIISIKFGPLWIAVMYCITCLLNVFLIVTECNKKCCVFNFASQIEEILPSLLLSIIMCGIVFFIGTITDYDNILFIQIVIGCIIYVFGSKLFNKKYYNFCLSIIRGERII